MPIVAAVVLWARIGQASAYAVYAVVAAVNKGAAKDPLLAHLLRLLTFVTVILDIHWSMEV